MKSLTTICAAVSVILAATGFAQATTLNVPSIAYPTIQSAIDAAANGYEIEVAPGTYLELINFNGKAVRLYSRDGAADTKIDGDGADIVVRCDSDEGANTILEGFTITGGSGGAYGGGMFNFVNCSPTVTNCIFTGNSAGTCGAGMNNSYNSNPNVTGCTFINNSAQWGGGMFNFTNSSPTVTDCTFTGNSASVQGGGMYNWKNSSPTVTNCKFTGNFAGGGGGMFNDEDCSPTVTNCTFSGNSATNSSGGMRNDLNSNPKVTNCTFTGNSAGNNGGGMHNTQNSNPEVTNCTFTVNSAGIAGGGMYNRNNCSPIVTGCTFSGNAADLGGGMSNQVSSSPTATNCILWGNGPDNIDGPATITYSNIQGGWPGDGNIDADPFFADFDGRLSAGSPCIDAGDSFAVLVATDLDGNPRIVGLEVDMGAYEFQEPLQHAAAKTEQLIDEVVVLNLQQGIENSFNSKLDAVSKALDDVNQNNDVAAINALQAFINAIEAQRGKKITNEDADELITAAQYIIDLLLS